MRGQESIPDAIFYFELDLYISFKMVHLAVKFFVNFTFVKILNENIIQ